MRMSVFLYILSDKTLVCVKCGYVLNYTQQDSKDLYIWFLKESMKVKVSVSGAFQAESIEYLDYYNNRRIKAK